MANLTDTQKEEAKNDLLLADIELRLEQIRSMRPSIDQTLADIDRTRADHLRIIAEHDRRRQEIRHAPWLVAFAAITAAAAVFAAGGIVGGLLVRLFIG